MSEKSDWSCCAGKACCGSDMDRRDFMKTSAAAAGALGLMASASASGELSADEQAAFEQWTASLLDVGERRVYTGKELDNIAMPMGGIGCGQLYLGGRGDIVSWQIVNNFNTGARVNCPNFAAWAKPAGGAGKARLLLEGGKDTYPGMEAVRFSGEYPFAWLDYTETRDAWPLAIRLESYSPFIPLDAKNSGLPAVVFRYEIENTSSTPVEAALLGMLPNLVGWDGYGTLPRLEHPDFSRHWNEVLEAGDTTHLRLGAENALRHRLDRPVALNTGDRAVAQALRLVKNLRVDFGAPLPKPAGDRPVVYYFADFPNGGVGEDFQRALDDVAHGAGMVIAGGERSLFAFGAGNASHRRAKVFEDWEKGGYDGWDLDGDCWGTAPATGAISWQSPVSGFRGKALVNTFFGSDDGLGTAKSKPFRLKHKYIHLLVGGGHFEKETCINLVDETGYVLRSAHGHDTEVLASVTWDVSVARGKELHFEIIDNALGGWGHILVDDIVFSNSAVSPFADGKLTREVLDALPVRWRSARRSDDTVEAHNVSANLPGLKGLDLRAKAVWKLRGLKLAKDAEVLLHDEHGNPLVIAAPHGKGRIVVCLGQLSATADWLGIESSREISAALVAHAIGASYSPAEPSAPGAEPDDYVASTPHHGSMCLSVRGGTVETCACWNDFDALWKAFSESGQLPASADAPSKTGLAWNAAAAAHVQLGAGEKRSIEFVISWHFPNRTRTSHYGWGPGPFQYDHRLGNQYNNHFEDAFAASRYIAEHRDTLANATRAFHDAFYSTTAPRYFLDAITANLSIVRSPIYIWLEDGTVGGFEGSDSCCPMNCTHVYNYAMAMPYVFPQLERNVRELDLLVNRDPTRNFIPHRTTLPLSVPRLGDDIGGPQHHALDGELGGILKLYREWKVCGDRAWLDRTWPAAKLVMEHVLKEHDVDGDGVFKGEQPNTYDTHLFGSNMFIGGLYLGALRAAEELASIMGDHAFAQTMRARYESGAKGYDALCWNGEYYYNVFNAPGVDPSVYNQNNCYGTGCHADQVLGQWWAYHLGLGSLCDQSRMKTALASIYRHNWRKTLRDHVHKQRVFAKDDEKGLLIVTWPQGGRPDPAILYCDEVWTGIEYEVAGAMLYEGMVTEALQIIRGARDRYTGDQRNPWSEIECGGHYARAMSAYALLHAAAGLDYDAGAQRLALAPRFNRDDFKTFFSTGSGWGVISLARKGATARCKIEVHGGEVALRELQIDHPARSAKALGGVRLQVTPKGEDAVIHLKDAQTIRPGSPLALTLHA